jgi:hypothetical protein
VIALKSYRELLLGAAEAKAMLRLAPDARRSQLLRGRVVAGGRKPWLGVAFERLLTGP